MEQDERAHIQMFADMVEIIAARIEADLLHVAGTYCSPTAISAETERKSLLPLLDCGYSTTCSNAPH
jgi:hypothetical protein